MGEKKRTGILRWHRPRGSSAGRSAEPRPRCSCRRGRRGRPRGVEEGEALVDRDLVMAPTQEAPFVQDKVDGLLRLVVHGEGKQRIGDRSFQHTHPVLLPEKPREGGARAGQGEEGPARKPTGQLFREDITREVPNCLKEWVKIEGKIEKRRERGHTFSGRCIGERMTDRDLTLAGSVRKEANYIVSLPEKPFPWPEGGSGAVLAPVARKGKETGPEVSEAPEKPGKAPECSESPEVFRDARIPLTRKRGRFVHSLQAPSSSTHVSHRARQVHPCLQPHPSPQWSHDRSHPGLLWCSRLL